MRRMKSLLAGICLTIGIVPSFAHDSPDADIWQAKNGKVESPSSPVAWTTGNATSANTHCLEGHSIPYRVVNTGVSKSPHDLKIKADINLGPRSVMNYKAHCKHLQLPDTAESVNPLPEVSEPFDFPKALLILEPLCANRVALRVDP